MIDLRADMARVRAFLIGGLEAFRAERPAIRVSMVAVYCCPWAGWLVLSLDTREHSDAHVAEWAPRDAARGVEWAGQDHAGRFCDNAPDMEFHAWRELAMEHWQAECEGPSRTILQLDGRVWAPSTANEDYNRPFFEALVPTVREVGHHPALARLELDATWRSGVQMLDSQFAEYWVHQGRPGDLARRS